MTDLQQQIIEHRKSGAGYKQIAHFCGVNREYVRYVLKKYDIKEVWQPKTIACEFCGKIFVQRSSAQRFCSGTCSAAKRMKTKEHTPRLRDCAICGKPFLSSHGKKVCSEECQKERNKRKYKKYDDAKRKRTAKEKTVWKRFCPACGKEFSTDRAEKKFCSAQCGKKYRGAGRLYILREEKRVQKAVENDKTVNLRVLIKRDKNICAICRRECNLYDYTVTETGALVCGDTYPTIDHIYPLSKGGSNTWDNVQLACMKCNREKGNVIDG